MSKRRLPVCAIQSPTCGSCHGDTEHDGDTFYCPDCLLDYGDGQDGTEATFRNEDTEPCGAECTNEWHINGQMGAWDCHPCALPKGHHRGLVGFHCWTDCTPISPEADR